MQLALVLMILATVLLSQGDASQGVATTPALWLGFVAGLIFAPLTAACGSVWIARGITRDFPDYRFWLQRFERLQTVVLLAWLAATGLVIVGCQWPQIVRGNWKLGRWPLIDEIAILAPSLVALLVIWSMYWLVDRSLRKSAGESMPATTLAEYVGLHVRQHLGLPLVPVLFVMLLQDLAPYAQPWLGEGATEYAGPLALPLMLLVLPWLLKFIWHTEPLAAGALRGGLEELCRASGCRVREILVWKTGGRLPNAAITGFLPRLRYLLLSDALLDRLDEPQLEAVVRHELAHLTRRHLLNRLLVLTLPVWLMLCVRHEYPQLAERFALAGEGWGLPRLWQELLLWPAVAGAYAIFAIGSYSKLLEYDADLAVLDAAPPDADAATRVQLIYPFTTALARVSGSLHQRSWLHPSVIERAMFLRRCAQDPSRARMYRSRLDWFIRGVLVAFAVSGLWVLLA